jgi:hypothetical protein
MGFWSRLKALLSGPKPEPFNLSPPKGEGRALAEQLDLLCHKLGCSYERDITGQQIRLTLVFPSGERLCGQGPTTLEAFSAVLKVARKVHDL